MTASPSQIRLLLVRHAETERLDSTRSEARLSPRGIEQAHLLGLRLVTEARRQGAFPAQIFCPRAPRAWQTAEILRLKFHALEGRDLEIVTMNPLQEHDIGLEAQAVRPPREEWIACMDQRGINDVPPNGESIRQVTERVTRGLLAIIRYKDDRPFCPIIVSHSIPLGCLIAEYMGYSPRFAWTAPLGHASLTILKHGTSAWILEGPIGDVSHLPVHSR